MENYGCRLRSNGRKRLETWQGERERNEVDRAKRAPVTALGRTSTGQRRGQGSRQRLKAWLKRLVYQLNMPTLIPFGIIALDFIDDGQVNMSIFTGILT